MRKNIQILSIDGDSLLKLFPDFMISDSIDCPKYPHKNFCIKDKYTEEEQKIIDLIPNVKKARFRFCPTICSGRRGDGSRYKERCEYFEGYGNRKEDVWNYDNPAPFLHCNKTKSGTIKIKRITSDCKKRRSLIRSTVTHNLIQHFNSGCLEQVSFEECLKCSHFDKKMLKCQWKPKCEEGNKGLLTMMWGCSYGDCESCTKTIKKV